MANNSTDATQVGEDENCFLRKHKTAFTPISIIYDNLPYPILVLGILLNGITIITTRRKARTSSGHFYMMMVAWADLYATVSAELIKIFEEFKEYNSIAECKLIGFHEIFPSQFAILLLVFMTFDRYLAITKPLRSNRLCTVRRGVITSLILVVVLLIYNISTIIVFGGKDDGHGRINCIVTIGRPWRTVFEISNKLIMHYLPFISLLTFNIIIAKTVCRAVKRQSALTGSKQGPRVEATRRITIMVVIVSFAFLVLVFPSGVAFLMMLKYDSWEDALKSAITHCGVYNESMIYLYYIGSVLYPFNHVINGLIYLISSSQFRRDFLNSIRCLRNRKRHRQRKAGFAMSSATVGTSVSYAPVADDPHGVKSV